MDPVVHTLLSASEQGHKQRIAALLAENPDRTEVCDDEGSTPLMYAAANGRENVLQLLLQVRENVKRGGYVWREEGEAGREEGEGGSWELAERDMLWEGGWMCPVVAGLG